MPILPKVLIVDDDLRMCHSTAALFSDQDYVLQTCNSGKSALDHLKNDNFDLVLLDMIIPDIDGYQIMDHINEQKIDTLVIVITGHVSTESAIGALRRGAYDYIRKPFEPEELLTTVKNGLDHKRLKREHEVINNKLSLTEKQYRFLVQNSPDIIYTLDHKGNFTFISNAVEKLLNFTIEQLVGRHYSLIVHEEDLEKAKWFFAERRTGERAASGIEMRLKISNGNGRLNDPDMKYLTIELKSSGIYDKPTTEKGKKFLGTHGVARDINDRKQLEAQLHHAQRMEALGTLAGGVAHDFNNLMMGILGNVSLMLFGTDHSHPHYEKLKNIENMIQSCSKLTNQLLGYARKGKYEVKPVSLNHIIKESLETFGRARKEIEVHRKLAEDLAAVEMDEAQIQQVLMNLYVNAADAMPKGGHLSLETANVTHKEIKDISYEIEPGNYVMLKVTDSGIGIDVETIDYIFDPFFTTKERGRGTGLGLASVYGIIKGHGGYIDVESQKGLGTSFYIYIPASDKTAQKTIEMADQILEGKGTILLVDDEEMIIDVGTQMLQIFGYNVIEAQSGREAIEVYRKNKDHIDLIILDVIMPEMGGSEVYDTIKEVDPNVKVLLSSGYSIDGQAAEMLEQGCDGFIKKPFNMEDLSKKLSKILSRD
jgi:PAS domain S-box-containing protein